jgi:hypothetical protein
MGGHARSLLSACYHRLVNDSAQAERDRMAKELAEAQERNAELQKHLDETATKLLHTVNDRNSLGNQIDLLRDELMRIRARIGETGLADEHSELRSIADYCDRAQQDIAVRYSVIGQRDYFERSARRLRIELEDAKRELDQLSRSIRQQQLMDEEMLGLKERIRRLEEAGDGLLKAMSTSEDSMPYCDWVCMSADAKNNWRKAKEAKP